MVVFNFLPITAVECYLIGKNINHTMDGITIPHIFVGVIVSPKCCSVFANYKVFHITFVLRYSYIFIPKSKPLSLRKL